jgi:putative inorganic carbon (hco3(-)) transporter
MEWAITFLIVAPALMLAASRSSLLMDYAIWVFALNRGTRRIVDYYCNGHFNPLSPISLTPLAIGGLLLLVGYGRFGSLDRRARRVFLLFAVALGIGTTVGVMHNGIGAVYSLGEWVSGLGAMLFAATNPKVRTAGNRWMKTMVWSGLVVAVYGWWQYYTIPPWDGAWLVQSGMSGYMGIPEPTKMTCFSTLHERGPCAGFLAFAALPMILNRRWRVLGGWVPVLFLLATMTLTGVRAMFITVALTAIIYPAVSRGAGLARILMLTAVVTLAGSYGLDKLPGSEKFTQRFSKESLLGEGSSLQGRLRIYEWSAGAVLSSPLGFGLGSSGMARRVAAEDSTGIGDAGYTQVIGQFGWAGSLCFFGALALLWKEVSRRFEVAKMEGFSDAGEPFAPAARAVMLAMLVLLFVADVFAGFSVMWIIFGCAINPWELPLPAPEEDLLPFEEEDGTMEFSPFAG